MGSPYQSDISIAPPFRKTLESPLLYTQLRSILINPTSKPPLIVLFLLRPVTQIQVPISAAGLGTDPSWVSPLQVLQWRSAADLSGQFGSIVQPKWCPMKVPRRLRNIWCTGRILQLQQEF